MDDLISRQALMKEFANFVRDSNNSDFARTPTWNDAVSLVESMPSAQSEITETQVKEYCEKRCLVVLTSDAFHLLESAQQEALTDKEQRIFLSAMSREEKVCKEVGAGILVRTCHEIIRKVKGALWTI